MRTLPPHCGGLETEEPLSLWAQGAGSTVGAESGVRVLWRGAMWILESRSSTSQLLKTPCTWCPHVQNGDAGSQERIVFED